MSAHAPRRVMPFSALAVFLAACSLTGCSGYQAPSIAVESTDITETTDEAVAVDFNLRLKNPNDQPIELQQFEYSLRVNGDRVYKGRRAAQATLARSGTTMLHLPAVIPYDRTNWTSGSLPQVASYRLRGSLVYLTPGALAETLLDLGVRRPTVSFKSEGRLTFQTVESASAESSISDGP